MFLGPLSRYLLKEFIPSFFGANLMILFILMMFQLVKLSETILGKGLSSWDVANLIGSLAITFLPASIPISCLTSANMIVGRMSQDSEFIALITSGIPGRSILKRFTVIGFIVAAFTYWASMYGVPQANFRFNDVLDNAGRKAAEEAITPKVLINNFHGMLLYVDAVDPITRAMKNVFVFDNRDPSLPTVVTSPTAFLEKKNKDFSFRFVSGEMHVDRKESSYQKILFDEYWINLPVNFQYQTIDAIPLGMDYGELQGEIAKATEGKSKWDLITLRLEFYRRQWLPVSCFLFLILGGLFGMGHYRSLFGRPVVVSIIMTAAYWSIFLVYDSLARKGMLVPERAMLYPNVVVVFFCILLFKVKQRYV